MPKDFDRCFDKNEKLPGTHWPMHSTNHSIGQLEETIDYLKRSFSCTA